MNASAPDAHIVDQDAFLRRLLQVPLMIEPRLSPDGNWVAWIWAGLDKTTQMWLAPSNGNVAPRCLVADDWDCDRFTWSPDSTSIVYARSKYGDERVSLHQVYLDSRPTRALTEDRPDYYIFGGELTPDGQSLVFAANVDVASGQEIEPALIYAQDIETGRRRVLARPARAAFTQPRISPDGRHVLYERNDRDPAGYQLWLTDLEGGFDRLIVDVGAKDKVSGSWAPDGNSIIVIAEAGQHRRLGLWRLSDGLEASGSLTWLIDDSSWQIVDAHWPPRWPDIIITESRNARATATLLDPKSGELRRFTTDHGTLLPLGPSKGGEWIALQYGAQHPARLVRVLPGDPAIILGEISRHPMSATVAADELIPAEDFRWIGDDGREIQGWLYRARGVSSEEARGTILHIHGGPARHYEDQFLIQPQYYTSLGFNVLQPNYRGSSGFSLEYQQSIKLQGWGGAEQADIRSGAEALIKAGIAKPGKIGITGTSYGGYSAWWAITHFPPDVIKAAAPICGMTDLTIDFQTTRPNLRPFTEDMMGGTPETAAERFFERSPINFVDRIDGHLLIVQGANDPNVTMRNVTDMCARLDAAGKSYDTLFFPDEGHGIVRPHNRASLYRRLAHFFDAAFK